MVRIGVGDQSYAEPRLELADSIGQLVGIGVRDGFYNESLEFTAPADGFYTISVIGAANEEDGYLLTIR